MVIVDFLFALPLWLLGAVLIGSLVSFGLVALWVARRWVLPRLRLDHLFFRLPDGWDAGYDVAGSTYGSDHYPLVGWMRAGAADDTVTAHTSR